MLKSSLAALVLVLAGGHASVSSIAASPATRSAVQPARPDAPADPEVRALVRLVNQHRAAIGCPPLV